MKALFELTRMRWILLLRQPEIMFWAFVFPLLLSLVLGLAFRERESPRTLIGVMDGFAAGEIVGVFDEVSDVDVLTLGDDDEADRRLRSGAVDLVIAIEPGLALRYDESRPESAMALLRVEDALQRAAGREDPLTLEREPRTVKGTRYVDWFVPGLLALSVMSTSVWAVGFSFVDARQKRLLERFLVTPMSRASFLFSHVLARLALLVLEVLVLVAFARYALGVPIAGTLPAILIACMLGGLTFAGIGVLLGSRSRTLEGAAGLINLTMMPMGLSAGVFFSYERFSEGLQDVIRFLPLAPFVDTVRGVMLEGHGLGDFTGAITVQLAWGLAAFGLGLALFRWR